MLRNLALVMLLGASPARADGDQRHVGVSLSYFGETLTHPGVQAAAERTVLAAGAHELLARVLLGGFVHPRLYADLFAGAALAYQVTATFGLRGEVSVGAAYVHTFLASPAYTVASDGRVSVAANPGTSGFMPSASLGVGWVFDQGRSPWSVMLSGQASWQFPWNTRSVFHPAVLVGATWRL